MALLTESWHHSDADSVTVNCTISACAAAYRWKEARLTFNTNWATVASEAVGGLGPMGLWAHGPVSRVWSWAFEDFAQIDTDAKSCS